MRRLFSSFAIKVQVSYKYVMTVVINYASQTYVFERKVRIRRGKMCVLLMGVPGDHRLQYVLSHVSHLRLFT
jgi:hypothetical protein